MTSATLVATYRIMAVGRQSSHRESNSSVWKNEEDMEEQVY